MTQRDGMGRGMGGGFRMVLGGIRGGRRRGRQRMRWLDGITDRVDVSLSGTQSQGLALAAQKHPLLHSPPRANPLPSPHVL